MRFEVPDGATPIDDSEGLIPPVATYAELCAAEAENILAAAGRHLSRRKGRDAAWLDEAFVRRLHADMFGDVWAWAGTYRRTGLTVGVPSHKVAEEVGRLLGDFAYWNTQEARMPVLERAVRLHHRLVWIHPFKNGNGRHARMAADIFLHSQRHRLPAWPDGGMAGATDVRRRYLAALRLADRGDFALLMDFTRSLLPV